MVSSTVIAIPNEEDEGCNNIKQRSMVRPRPRPRRAKLIHSAKVGSALLLASLLLYLLDPIYTSFRERSMWALMTVVVIFELSAGATLEKGLNRVAGTVLGGGLGSLVATLADKAGGKVGNALVTATSVFIFGAVVSYCRMAPSIKKRYDYGATIALLTFNLAAVAGLRTNKVIEIARDRVLTIAIGLAVCIATSLLVFPVWSSDELHYSTAANFEKLGHCIQECLEEYFHVMDQDGTTSCQSVMYSKSNDESLANFARLEPWHGKFGFSHPWDKHLQIASRLRELAAIITTLRKCLQSFRQPPSRSREWMKDPCRAVGSAMASIMGELGECVRKMERCKAQHLINASKLESIKVELIGLTAMVASSSSSSSSVPDCCKLQEEEAAATAAASDDQKNGSAEGIAMVASFLFLLLQIAEKMEVLAKDVEELGKLAGFRT